MKLAIVVLFLFLVACGTSRKKWVEAYCNESGAYKLGESDARASRPHSVAPFKRKCSRSDREKTSNAYLQGYQEAGGEIKVPKEGHQYGNDPISDLVHAINKEPTKKQKTDGEQEKKSDSEVE